MEHRIILGGEQFLPFARSCITKLKKLGMAYANQSFEVDGVSIKVRIEPGHEYIRIEGGGGGNIYCHLLAISAATTNGVTEHRDTLLQFQEFRASKARVIHTGVTDWDTQTTLSTYTDVNEEDHVYTSLVTKTPGGSTALSAFIPYDGKVVKVANEFTSVYTYVWSGAGPSYTRNSTTQYTASTTVSVGAATDTVSYSATVFIDEVFNSNSWSSRSGDRFIGPPVITGENEIRYTVATPAGGANGALPYDQPEINVRAAAPFHEGVFLRDLETNKWSFTPPRGGCKVEESLNWLLPTVSTERILDGTNYGSTIYGRGASGAFESISREWTRNEVGWHKQGHNFIDYGTMGIRTRRNEALATLPEAERVLQVMSATLTEQRYIRAKNSSGYMNELEYCKRKWTDGAWGVSVLAVVDLMKVAAVKNNTTFKEFLEINYAPYPAGTGIPDARFEPRLNQIVLDRKTYPQQQLLKIVVKADEALLFDPELVWEPFNTHKPLIA